MQTVDLSTTQARTANRNELAIAYSAYQSGNLQISESDNPFFRNASSNNANNDLFLDNSLQVTSSITSDTFNFEIVTSSTVIAEGILSINNGGNFAGNLSNLNDDAFLYGGKGFNINSSNLLLPLVRDQMVI
ncbi:MAG: hypothetical protein HC785_05740 [Calothrix sp. CSU_2_0]|nr:hypothetical protein [Calothrix sp. CSU_2_0]